MIRTVVICDKCNARSMSFDGGKPIKDMLIVLEQGNWRIVNEYEGKVICPICAENDNHDN